MGWRIVLQIGWPNFYEIRVSLYPNRLSSLISCLFPNTFALFSRTPRWQRSFEARTLVENKICESQVNLICSLRTPYAPTGQYSMFCLDCRENLSKAAEIPTCSQSYSETKTGLLPPRHSHRNKIWWTSTLSSQKYPIACEIFPRHSCFAAIVRRNVRNHYPSSSSVFWILFPWRHIGRKSTASYLQVVWASRRNSDTRNVFPLHAYDILSDSKIQGDHSQQLDIQLAHRCFLLDVVVSV